MVADYLLYSNVLCLVFDVDVLIARSVIVVVLGVITELLFIIYYFIDVNEAGQGLLRYLYYFE